MASNLGETTTDFVENTKDLNSTIKGKKDSKYTDLIENTLYNKTSYISSKI